jgi:hypothetical protein
LRLFDKTKKVDLVHRASHQRAPPAMIFIGEFTRIDKCGSERVAVR